jgi:hypothetical protein
MSLFAEIYILTHSIVICFTKPSESSVFNTSHRLSMFTVHVKSRRHHRRGGWREVSGGFGKESGFDFDVMEIECTDFLSPGHQGNFVTRHNPSHPPSTFYDWQFKSFPYHRLDLESISSSGRLRNAPDKNQKNVKPNHPRVTKHPFARNERLPKLKLTFSAYTSL